eukprot:gene34253-44252_t
MKDKNLRKQQRQTAKRDNQRWNRHASDPGVGTDRRDQPQEEVNDQPSSRIGSSDNNRIPRKQNTTRVVVETTSAIGNAAEEAPAEMVDDSGIDPNHDPHQYDVDEAELTGGNKSVDTAEEDGEESEEDNEELQPDELEKRDWLTAWRRPTTMAPGRRKDYIIFSDNATTPYCPPPNTILPSETSEVKRRREFRNLLNQLSYLSDGEHSHLGRIAMQATTSEYREDREARFYQLAGIQLDCSKPSNSLPADKQGDSLYQHAYAIQLHYEERCQVHYQEFLELLTDARNNIDNYMLSQQMEPWMQQMKYLFDSIMMLTPDIPGHNVLFEPIWENVTNPRYYEPINLHNIVRQYGVPGSLQDRWYFLRPLFITSLGYPFWMLYYLTELLDEGLFVLYRDSLHQDTLWEDRLEPMAERNREAFNSLINSHNWEFSADAVDIYLGGGSAKILRNWSISDSTINEFFTYIPFQQSLPHQRNRLYSYKDKEIIVPIEIYKSMDDPFLIATSKTNHMYALILMRILYFQETQRLLDETDKSSILEYIPNSFEDFYSRITNPRIPSAAAQLLSREIAELKNFRMQSRASVIMQASHDASKRNPRPLRAKDLAKPNRPHEAPMRPNQRSWETREPNNNLGPSPTSSQGNITGARLFQTSMHVPEFIQSQPSSNYNPMTRHVEPQQMFQEPIQQELPVVPRQPIHQRLLVHNQELSRWSDLNNKKQYEKFKSYVVNNRLNKAQREELIDDKLMQMCSYMDGYKQAFELEQNDKFFRAIEALSVPINAPRVQTKTLRQFPDNLMDLTYENRDEIFRLTKWFIDNLKPQANFETFNDTAVQRDIEQFIKKFKERELSRHPINRNTPLYDLMMKDQLVPRSYSALLTRINTAHAKLLDRALEYQLQRVDVSTMPPPNNTDRKQKASDRFNTNDQNKSGTHKKTKQDYDNKVCCRVCGMFETTNHTTSTCFFKGNHEYANSDLSKPFAQSAMGIKYKAEHDLSWLKWDNPPTSTKPASLKTKSSSNNSISTKTTIPSTGTKGKKTRFEKQSGNKKNKEEFMQRVILQDELHDEVIDAEYRNPRDTVAKVHATHIFKDPTSAYTRTDYLSALIHESAVLDTLTSDDKDDIDHSAYEEWMEKVNRTVNQAPPSESVKDLLRKDLFKDEISATPAKVPPFTVNYDVNAWVQPKNMTNARNYRTGTTC